jgi:hypothetical protein
MRLACVLIIALLVAGCAKSSVPAAEAQSASIVGEQKQEFKFTTKFYDAVDKWVAFKSPEDSLYLAGVVYSIRDTGFMFQPETGFTITNNGLERAKENSDVFRFSRLDKNTIDVAVLSEKEIEQLGLPKEPKSGLNPINLYSEFDLNPMAMYLNSYGKCCCSKDAFVGKACEDILWQTFREMNIMKREKFQEAITNEFSVRRLCPLVVLQFACNGCGPRCPDGKWGCPEDKCTKIDELEDILGELEDIDDDL